VTRQRNATAGGVEGSLFEKTREDAGNDSFDPHRKGPARKRSSLSFLRGDKLRTTKKAGEVLEKNPPLRKEKAPIGRSGRTGTFKANKTILSLRAIAEEENEGEG